jgi:hypothetical protein
MLIFSHRGITSRQSVPNSLNAFQDALHRGFSIEVDVRGGKNGAVISHDPVGGTISLDASGAPIPTLRSFLEGIRGLLPSQMIAFHIKGPHNARLIEEVCQHVEGVGLGHAFLFDVPLQELFAIKVKFPECRLAVSIGEANYSPTVYTKEQAEPFLDSLDYIWADEWRGGLYTDDFFQWCKNVKKQAFLISPELHRAENHPFARNPKKLWTQIKPFHFGGICTDFPKEAHQFFHDEAYASL